MIVSRRRDPVSRVSRQPPLSGRQSRLSDALIEVLSLTQMTPSLRQDGFVPSIESIVSELNDVLPQIVTGKKFVEIKFCQEWWVLRERCAVRRTVHFHSAPGDIPARSLRRSR